MKRLLIFSLLLAMPSFVKAGDIWRSTNTLTTHNFVPLCEGTQRGILHGICTSFGVASASMTVYNSTWTVADSQFLGPISTLVADQCKYYDVALPKGLSYRKTNAASVTILYQCY